MFGHIRRHQKWLWAVIATLTIVSFVIFLDPTTGRRGGGRSIFGRSPADYGTINGREITAEEFERAKTASRPDAGPRMTKPAGSFSIPIGAPWSGCF
ncbi:MAG: hypothetical protein E6L09_13140 [Verrucomicrobia bacterium]|nr:MAG: hypothetical protein E6L09_13140 [Verrucomicrobiota bacterium]